MQLRQYLFISLLFLASSLSAGELTDFFEKVSKGEIQVETSKAKPQVKKKKKAVVKNKISALKFLDAYKDLEKFDLKSIKKTPKELAYLIAQNKLEEKFDESYEEIQILCGINDDESLEKRCKKLHDLFIDVGDELQLLEGKEIRPTNAVVPKGDNEDPNTKEQDGDLIKNDREDVINYERNAPVTKGHVGDKKLLGYRLFYLDKVGGLDNAICSIEKLNGNNIKMDPKLVEFTVSVLKAELVLKEVSNDEQWRIFCALKAYFKSIESEELYTFLLWRMPETKVKRDCE